MRGLTLMELLGLYALGIGLIAIIAAGFLISIPLGVLAIGIIGLLLGPTLLYFAAAREAAAKANGQHASGGQLQGVRGAA